MKAEQKTLFITGNEAVAEAARAIRFHFMGYYPITPSTEIAEKIDELVARRRAGHGPAGRRRRARRRGRLLRRRRGRRARAQRDERQWPPL